MNHRPLIKRVGDHFSLAFSALPSFACLNDTSIRAGEEEFRSRYEFPNSGDAAVKLNRPNEWAINPWSVGALAIGSGLAAGSTLVAIRRRKRRGAA